MPTRLNLFIGAIVLIALAVAGISARAWFGGMPTRSQVDAPQPPEACCQNGAQGEGAAMAPAPSGLFVALALPVTITVGAVNSDKGFSEIPLAINAKAESKVTNLNLVLFELSQAGKLLGAESINGVVDLTTKRSDNTSLRARRMVKPGSPTILALESVSGPDGSWQIDFSELLQAATAVAGN